MRPRQAAKTAGKPLFFIQAVDAAPFGGENEYKKMLNERNCGKTKKLMSILPIFVGMRVSLQQNLLPPQYVKGAIGTVMGIEFHPSEKPIFQEAGVPLPSLVSDGCVLLMLSLIHISEPTRPY